MVTRARHVCVCACACACVRHPAPNAHACLLDTQVSIWRVDAGLEIVSLTAAMESHPLHCAFSPDGNKLAVTESNGNVLVWNVLAGCQWYMIYQVNRA
jgi:hypothetical protein